MSPNVCHAIRSVFDHQVSQEALENGWLNHECPNCDHYGFPCLNCARYVYEGRLGSGYPSGPGDDSNDYDD